MLNFQVKGSGNGLTFNQKAFHKNLINFAIYSLDYSCRCVLENEALVDLTDLYIEELKLEEPPATKNYFQYLQSSTTLKITVELFRLLETSKTF